MADDEPPESVGLYGDGDEVSAIREVEGVFGVKLNFDDAPQWLTAGDVFSSLVKSLPPDEGVKTDTWTRFAEAITSDTGVDPTKIVRTSPLFGGGTTVPWWAITLVIGAICALAYFLRL